MPPGPGSNGRALPDPISNAPALVNSKPGPGSLRPAQKSVPPETASSTMAALGDGFHDVSAAVRRSTAARLWRFAPDILEKPPPINSRRPSVASEVIRPSLESDHGRT